MPPKSIADIVSAFERRIDHSRYEKKDNDGFFSDVGSIYPYDSDILCETDYPFPISIEKVKSFLAESLKQYRLAVLQEVEDALGGIELAPDVEDLERLETLHTGGVYSGFGFGQTWTLNELLTRLEGLKSKEV